MQGFMIEDILDFPIAKKSVRGVASIVDVALDPCSFIQNIKIQDLDTLLCLGA